MSESLVIVSGKRTPFGGNGGSLKDVNPTDLGVAAAQAAMTQAGVEGADIDHTIVGNVIQSAADSAYSPRHIGLKVGIPKDRPALGLNRLCGSGFQVLVEAFHQMLAQDTKVALVGGIENMSLAPYVLRKARWGMKMGHGEVGDMLTDALVDSYAKAPMAITAENLAVRYKISREESDVFSLSSQEKTAAAIEAGHFKDEIEPYTMKDRKGNEVVIEADEHPRPQTTLEGLAKLRPVFKKDGVVTAGSASGIVDGAAMMVVMTESEANRRDLQPLARMVSYGVVGCEPTEMGIGPAPASRQALKRADLKLSDMDLVEVNEAFSAQTLAVAKELELDSARLNVNGGAIAIGHPLAASGSRITMTMAYELKRRQKRYGLVSACIGGGQGIAIVLENLS